MSDFQEEILEEGDLKRRLISVAAALIGIYGPVIAINKLIALKYPKDQVINVAQQIDPEGTMEYIQQEAPELLKPKHRRPPLTADEFNAMDITLVPKKRESPKRAPKSDIRTKDQEDLKGDALIQRAFDYIASSETSGDLYKYDRAYRDSKGLWTIGVGHLIGNGSDEDYKKSEFYKKELSDKEIKNMYIKELYQQLKRVLRFFPELYTYDPKLQVAILDGFYRGDLSGSPTAIQLIKKGKYKQAADEYLDNDEYKAAQRYIAKYKKPHGVQKRMSNNAEVIRNAEPPKNADPRKESAFDKILKKI